MASQNILRWCIAEFKEDGPLIQINGYSAPGQVKMLLETNITRMTLEEATKAQVLDSNEGRSLVIINPEQCYLIEINFSPFPVLFNETDQKLEVYKKMKTYDAFDCINNNAVCDKFYFGLPAIVCMTWLGMISTDI